jgi:hypothetical protein
MSTRSLILGRCGYYAGALVALVGCQPPATEGRILVEADSVGSYEVIRALGRPLASVRLTTADGDTLPLLDSTQRGMLILLVDPSDCFSCLKLEAEAWETHRIAETRGMGFRIVLAGGDTSIAREFSETERLPVPVLLDRAKSLDQRLGSHPHPLIVWTGPSGHIVGLFPRDLRAPSDLLRDIMFEVDRVAIPRREVPRLAR